MILAERVRFEEIASRAKRGTLLADDVDWLIAELDSYSQAWAGERESMRKSVEVNNKLLSRQEKMIGVMKLLMDRLRSSEGAFEYEIRMAEQCVMEH